MRLLRYGNSGEEIPCCLDEAGRVRSLADHVGEFSGASVSLDVLDRLRGLDQNSLPVLDGGGRTGACLADVPDFLCIGLNYARHARETGSPIPSEPIIFSKASSCLSGPFDCVRLPGGSTSTDWEVELGVVVGREATRIREEDALNHVAGYCIVNDVSERNFQTKRGGQWIKGKSAPTFGPVGPWLVTADEISDPQNLSLQLSVNGETQQNSSTSDMIFTVAQLVAYLSEFMTLRVGSIIATGTPEGVGLGKSPPSFLKPGDVMELSIESLGTQRQTVVEGTRA